MIAKTISAGSVSTHSGLHTPSESNLRGRCVSGARVIHTCEMPAAGKAINDLKRRLEQALERAFAEADSRRAERAIERERADVTLPARTPWLGSLLPVTHTRRELERIFLELGFTIESGPEVEDDFHNFQALNLPPEHPARDATDTFYVEGSLLLRTHTSPVQVRVMESRKPPLRVIAPGNVYRHDSDPTDSPMFHQVEGFVVDHQVTFADLKGTLEFFVHELYGPHVSEAIMAG